MSNKNTNNNLPKSCQEIAYYSDKLQYKEASFWEKLKLKMHISYCEKCKSYNEKNNLLTKLIKKNQYKSLDLNELKEIEEKVRANK